MSKLIIDHDGSIDDIIAVVLQILNSPNNIKAITLLPADSYVLPAAYVMERLKEYFFPKLDIPIGISYDEGVNLFPDVFRDDSWKLARLNIWADEKKLQTFKKN